jgi:hypothetical protein
MRFRNVDIEIPATGTGGTFIVDGTDIAGSVCDFTLSGGASRPTVVNVSLAVSRSARYAGPGVVQIGGAMAAFLESIGWTPPSQECTPPNVQPLGQSACATSDTCMQDRECRFYPGCVEESTGTGE